jgi:hypothetical protein
MEALQELINPRLAGDYPIDSVMKVSDCPIVPQTNKRLSVKLFADRVLSTRWLTLQSHTRKKSPA